MTKTLQRIGVIGSGDVAKRLASGFSAEGHSVAIGSRDPEKLRDWSVGVPAITVGNFSAVAAQSDVLILAVKGSAAEAAMELLPEETYAGKVIIDTTNPIAEKPPVKGVLQYFTSANESLMERLQQRFPMGHFVKAFNSVGQSCMIHPQADVKPTMFICGNEIKAKEIVTDLLQQVGWEVADFGYVESARALEHLCMLWCIPGFMHNDWRHLFKLMPAR